MGVELGVETLMSKNSMASPSSDLTVTSDGAPQGPYPIALFFRDLNPRFDSRPPP